MCRAGTELKAMPIGDVGAAMVERRNEQMRRLLYRCEDQCKEGGFKDSVGYISFGGRFRTTTRHALYVQSIPIRSFDGEAACVCEGASKSQMHVDRMCSTPEEECPE